MSSCPFVWNKICPDNYAPHNLVLAGIGAGSVASETENQA